MVGNSSDSSPAQSGGIGFLGLLAVVFITLKLTGFIAWSWWWVLLPLWLPLVIVLVVFCGWMFCWWLESRRH